MHKACPVLNSGTSTKPQNSISRKKNLRRRTFKILAATKKTAGKAPGNRRIRHTHHACICRHDNPIKFRRFISPEQAVKAPLFELLYGSFLLIFTFNANQFQPFIFQISK